MTNSDHSAIINPTTLPWANLRYLISAFVLVSLVFAIIAIWFSRDLIDSKFSSQQQHWIQKNQIIASSKEQQITLLEQRYADIAYSIARNDLVQVLLSELDLPNQKLQHLPNALQAQLPYLEIFLTDFTRNNNLLSTGIGVRSGQHQFISATAPSLSASEQLVMEQAIKHNHFAVGTPHIIEDRLQLSLAVPVLGVQTQQEERHIVGAALIRIDATQDLQQLLQPLPLADPLQTTYLLHPNDQDDLLRFALTPTGAAIAAPSFITQLAQLPSPPTQWLPTQDTQGTALLSVFIRSNSHRWVVQTNVPKAHALASFQQFQRNVWIANGFIFAILILAGFVVWRNAVAMRDHAMALQYKQYAAEMEDQQLLRSSIINSITDSIGVKDNDGTYFLCNDAFTKLTGHDCTTQSLTDAQLYEPPQLQQLLQADQRVLTEHQVQKVDLDLTPPDRQTIHLSSLRVPFKNHLGIYQGIVAVTRDVSKSVIAKQKIDKAVVATVNALTLAVEHKDPYFYGHSQRVAALAGQLAEYLACSSADVATCRLAGSLLGIKVLTAPTELLEKEQKLTQTEVDQIYQSLDKILQEIDFGLPVHETIRQLNHSLYETLAPADILLSARIVKIADGYLAMTSPRAYHAAATAPHTIEILRATASSQDLEILDALQVLYDEKKAS